MMPTGDIVRTDFEAKMTAILDRVDKNLEILKGISSLVLVDNKPIYGDGGSEKPAEEADLKAVTLDDIVSVMGGYSGMKSSKDAVVKDKKFYEKNMPFIIKLMKDKGMLKA